jgi:hypothetical protein
MAEFLTTAGTAHRLEQLITGAAARLTLLSPYLQVSPILLERLREAAERGVITSVVCRAGDLKIAERRQLETIPKLQLRFMENLHAKCYLSEQGVVITSMNLFHHSERQNREMGVFFGAAEAAYEDAAKEVASILAAAGALARVTEARTASLFTSPRKAPQVGRGFCVRCRRGIPLDPQRPFCIDCFQVWAEFQNAEYAEQYCHDCGEQNATCMARPLCYSCFRGAPTL